MEKFNLARISSVHKEAFSVIGDFGEVTAEVTGKLVYTAQNSLDFPAVGDWVYVQYFNDNTFAVINEILTRRTVLKRKTAGKQTEYQVIAANIDVGFIMQALDDNFNINRMERYLVMLNEGNVKPIILLCKKDLISSEELEEKINAIKQRINDTPIIAFSNETKEGFKQINETLLADKTYCLLGSSGVGKSTLLNNLMGIDKFTTQSIRDKDCRGRHTTTRRQLIKIKNGALIIDTPGMRELGNIEIVHGLKNTFDEIKQFSNKCKFSDCTHINEKECAVITALSNGDLSQERYQNYLKLKKESDYNQMSYLEKRCKDKQFGKMCKNYIKNKNNI